MIADAKSMTVKCAQPLGIGRYTDGTFLLDVAIAKEDQVKATKGAIAEDLGATIKAKELGIPFATTPVVALGTKAVLRYKRLGYPSVPKIVDAIQHGLMTGINLPKTVKESDFPISSVEAPYLAKSKAQPHRDLNGRKHSKRPYQMVHVDFKHMGIQNWGGATGSSTIVDDFSSRIH
jgi:hypothetical protein